MKSEEEPEVPAEIPEKFYLGYFLESSDPTAAAQVELGVNGEVLVCPRGVDTIIPDRFLEAAKNCTYKKFSNKIGESRKVSKIVTQYPF
ncbi:hypothetical protein BVY04_00125, partial [bacterium M21]